MKRAAPCSVPTRDSSVWLSFFFFNDTATTEIYTLSLHDALPICFHARRRGEHGGGLASGGPVPRGRGRARGTRKRVAVLEAYAGRGQRGNAGCVGQCAGQRLATLPDTFVPFVGAQRLLPERRRL